MIIITKDDNSKKKLIEIIQKELDFINSSFNVQKNLSTQILKYFKELATDIDINKDSEHIELFYLKSNKINDMLLKSNKNILEYENILSKVEELVTNASKLSVNDLISNIDQYNNVYKKSSNLISNNTSEIEAFLKETTPEFQSTVDIDNIDKLLDDKLLNNNISTLVSHLDNAKDNNTMNSTDSVEIKINDKKDQSVDKTYEYTSKENIIKNEDFLENTLIISEQDEHVILPYTIKNITKIFKANTDKYTDIYDVIDKLYTRPIKYYKNAPVARFREAYKLAKDKENISFKGSLDLAFECFFNSELHPAIISSCENLNQLDIYLSCLEYDELEDFYFFDIMYKIPPMKTNKTDYFNFK